MSGSVVQAPILAKAQQRLHENQLKRHHRTQFQVAGSWVDCHGTSTYLRQQHSCNLTSKHKVYFKKDVIGNKEKLIRYN